MKGYITYTSDSEYSPEHHFQISSWESPIQAIQSGEDTRNIIMMFVSMRKSIFYPVRKYIFKGILSDYINEAVMYLFHPRVEEVDVTSYVVPVKMDMPSVSITVKRNVYILAKVKENVYKQEIPLDIYEEYSLTLAKVNIDHAYRDVPLYTGNKGMFILLDRIPETMTI